VVAAHRREDAYHAERTTTRVRIVKQQILLIVLGLAYAGSAGALPPVSLEHVGTFQSPLYVSHAGDGRIFIVERAGRILVCDTPSCTSPTTFLDISTLVDTSDDGGLFTVAFHPNYASNGYFFVSYTEDGGGGS
jgi:hypothetical protein